MQDAQTRIADKVRGLAAEHRFTQQQIADAIGVSRKAVVERIQGRVAFTAPEVFALAAAFDVPVSRFFPDVAAERAA